MPRSSTRGSRLAARLFVGLVLAGCGGKLQGAALGGVPDDAAAQTEGDAAAATPVANGQSDDAATSSSQTFDGAAISLLPPGDASDLGGASLDGGIDPNGACPAAPGHWRCPVDGARLCGVACSLQCSCANGFWLCRLPPC